MKIFIDIGHPAHVHYFRNFIKIMEGKGHSFFVCARDKEVTHSLLNYYQIDYTTRGKGGKSIAAKLVYIAKADRIIYKLAKNFNPDVFLSFGSAYAAHVSRFMHKPHIAFDDTEHARFEHMMYVPFTDVVLTPTSFSKTIGPKQIFFHGYMELCSLHKNYFKADNNVKLKLGLKPNENYVIIRFVAWSANHDILQSGIKDETSQQIVDLLKDKYKIFITSESKLPPNLESYKLNIHPAELHSVLANAFLYIGEGSTTASECSILGIPNIYINSLTVGYCKEQDEKYGLSFHLKDDSKVIDVIKELLKKEDLSSEWKIKQERMLRDKIDVTAFMVWFVENYPKSFNVMKENPDYQFNFK
ncbi:MAG: DUF354 domain-containing protein [bacterium]|nr:DUF354 domain-containing protein [bacterium]